MKPDARRVPVVDHGSRGHAQRLRRFLDGEPAEESQLDDLARPRVERRQFGQRVVQRDDVHAEVPAPPPPRPPPTIPPRLARASPPDVRARRPPARDASSARWSRRSAPDSASARRASRADERKTPARDRSAAIQPPAARPKASGEPFPSVRAGRAERAVQGLPRHRSSTPAANRSHWRSTPSILSLSLAAAVVQKPDLHFTTAEFRL